jgi:hypothetical protein
MSSDVPQIMSAISRKNRDETNQTLMTNDLALDIPEGFANAFDPIQVLSRVSHKSSSSL